MIKRILVAIDPSTYSKTAIKYACKLAKSDNAEVTGIIVLDIPGIEKHIGAIPLGGSYYAEQLESAKKEEAQKTISKLLDQFKSICRDNNIKSHIAERQGIPSDKIIQEAKFYDLLVIGLKTYFNFETENKPGNSIEKILDHSATSIIAVPETLENLDNKKTFKSLICFDGSLPAVRALHTFVKVYSANETDITILTSDESKETADFLLSQAKDYLNSYGFKNIKLVWKTDNIKDLMDADLYKNSDLVVLGAHSNIALIDFIMGSLSNYLINKADKPLLLGL